MKKINSDIYWEFNGFLWKWIYKKSVYSSKRRLYW
jgi:hypothetical protein